MIQSIDHQTPNNDAEVLELMLDEFILIFNSLNIPFLQVFRRSLFISSILSNIKLIQTPINTKINKNESCR